MILIAWLFISPYVFFKERGALSAELRINTRIIVLGGFFCIFTYMMVLFAMQMSKISYVVAAREVSIIFSTYYGIFRLKEKHGKQKFAGALLIACGVFLIGISR
jgi:drug/metabolite transporter (DMT)-like permease